LSIVVKVVLGALLAPIVVPWVARTAEKYADRVAVDLGYGVLPAEVFTGLGYNSGQAKSARPRHS